MKKIRRIIWISLFSLFIFSLSYATQPSIPSLKMEMSIIHDGNWEVGKENTITFTFTPLEEVKHETKLPDEAELTLDSNFVLVSGTPSWSGFLKKGEQQSIKLTLKPTRPSGSWLNARVFSSMLQIRTDEEIKKLKEERVKMVEGSPYKEQLILGDYPEKVSRYQNAKGIRIEVKAKGGVSDTLYQQIDGVKTMKIKGTIRLDSLKVKEKKVEKSKKPSLNRPKNKVNSDSLKSEANSLQPYRVSGIFKYLNNFSILTPMKEVLLEVYRYDDLISDWVLQQSTTTDVDGRFTVYTNYSTIRVLVYPLNEGVWVFLTDGHLDVGDETYTMVAGFQKGDLSGDWDVPENFTTVTDLDFSGAWEIAHAVRLGYNYVKGINPFFPPEFAYVYWDPADSSVRTSFGSYGIGSVGLIIVQGASVITPEQRDEWDYSVVLHEYSHFLQDQYAEIPAGVGGDHAYHLPANLPGQIPARMAYIEGWANFFQGAILAAPSYVNRNNNNIKVLEFNLERPEPDVPYVNDYNGTQQTSPSASTPYYSGYDVEGSITETLRDIFDISNDDNYVIGSDTFGHNKDHNQADSWRDIYAIFDVFWDYDPAPSDPNHNHCWDFFEFIKGWKAQGYPIIGHFAHICNSHALYIKRGDANFDIKINLQDIIFLVNYIFKVSTSPLTICNGDPNNDGKVLLSDIVHLINYLFKGGLAPAPALC